jgi:cob(I)alamin adenosyltransferase
MKIYTRTGDSGETGLYGGQRVAKDDHRVEAYGTVDEANAALGVAASALTDPELRTVVLDLQSALFTVGADLATPTSRDDKAGKAIVPRVAAEQTEALEALIDRFEAELPPLTQFILPGGTRAAAALHLARAIARRAERCVVTLRHTEPDETGAEVLRYLNRLADLLFVLARAANQRAQEPDIPWRRP